MSSERIKKGKKGWLVGALAVALLAGGGFFVLSGSTHSSPAATRHAPARGHGPEKSRHQGSHEGPDTQTTAHDDSMANNDDVSWWEMVRIAGRNIQRKADQISHALEENERLSLENADLRLKLETARFECRAHQAKAHTESVQKKLKTVTGDFVGRTLETIAYRPPTHLHKEQLHTLAISYLKAQEDEKAAVILTQLVELVTDDTFHTSRDYLLAGVAWYRIDNFEMAKRYFELSLKAEKSERDARYAAQARLWNALAAKKTQKHAQSQQWLQELLDHHPHSKEAKWVNSKEARRERKIARD